jgi:uncharacterized protein YjhX (UPF0386 family)
MIHTDSSDAIEIVTSSGADIDVVIWYKLIKGVDFEPKEFKTKITTATTTAITLNVTSTVEIISLNCFNTDGAVSNDVTVQKNNGAVYKIIKKTLAAGESLNYEAE